MSHREANLGLNGSVPIQSIRAETPQRSEALGLIFYLEEVERQAELFNAAMSDAMEHALAGRATPTFRHLQSALFAGIVVDRFIQYRPVRFSKAIATARVTRLRELLGITDEALATSHLNRTKDIRDAFEHIDERFDEAVSSADVGSITDWYLAVDFMFGPGRFRWSSMRCFSPRTGVLYFGDEPIDMLSLDLDMLRLRHNAREAQAELAARDPSTGLLKFGPAQALDISLDRTRDYVAEWVEGRAAIIRDLAPGVDLDGTVRLFARPDDPT